jgi:hypothetical protein
MHFLMRFALAMLSARQNPPKARAIGAAALPHQS